MPDRSRLFARITRPRLAALAGFACGLALAGTVVAAPSPTTWAEGSFDPVSEARLVDLTNGSRAAGGLAPLEFDAELASIARWRSEDMAHRGYFSHAIPPQGGRVFEVIQARGYCFALAGENIGWNTYADEVATDEIQGAFLSSPGHRANILSERWEAIGVGAYKGAADRKLWTVLFADRCSSHPVTGARPGS